MQMSRIRAFQVVVLCAMSYTTTVGEHPVSCQEGGNRKHLRVVQPFIPSPAHRYSRPARCQQPTAPNPQAVAEAEVVEEVVEEVVATRQQMKISQSTDRY
jgi:hypothetical protein